MGKDRGRETRHPRGGVAELPSTNGGAGAPLPRSLANLRREISEKKWAEARQWAGGRTSKKKYRMPSSQKPDGAVANSSKRIASRFYQLKTGHCLTGQYLNWTKNRPTPQCWWCRHRTQTRDHLFKECPEWKPQQRILWAEVKKETGRWKDRWKVRVLLADGRCSRAVLDFLSATDVGRRAPAALLQPIRRELLTFPQCVVIANMCSSHPFPSATSPYRDSAGSIFK